MIRGKRNDTAKSMMPTKKYSDCRMPRMEEITLLSPSMPATEMVMIGSNMAGKKRMIPVRLRARVLLREWLIEA